MIKRITRKIIYYLISVDWIWISINLLRNQKPNTIFSYRNKIIVDRILNHTKVHGILDGPFKNIMYYGIESINSANTPKLLGTYESELHETIENLISEEYQNIVDIGCAEGYYAVGLATRLKSAKVYAYDISTKARNMCARLAQINEVNNRIHINERFNITFLSKIHCLGKNFIICDCEGAEKEIFLKQDISILAHWDILIETHDFIKPGTTSYLRELFSKTHKCKTIRSISDRQKARTFSCKLFKENNIHIKEIILGEGRPNNMEWIFLKSLKNEF